ncbi:MAG: T9SS type A sorting domain-containing protein, partial [Bacteroidia bacterium]|nr:T9SS type A sorting domain-containing protein [Bacteroidia bacterium]
VAAMTAPDECIVLNSAENAIAEFGQNSYVRGKLRRVLLGGATYPYHFPVGHQTTNINYQLATVQFSGANHGISSLLVFFNGQLPSSFMPVPNVPDQGVLINKTVGGGFWTLTPSPAMSNGTYRLTLNKRGWTQTGLVYGITKRANATVSWGLPGTHVSSTPGTTLVCVREGYTDFSDGDIGTGDTPFPVEGLSFTAVLENTRDALLTWTTQRETNNYGFEVQHAHQFPNDFEAIGLVEGHGTTYSPSYYRFQHKGLANGRHYYRLRQIDFDGNTSFSNIVEVMVDVDSDGHGASLYPNPAYDEITLKMNLAEDETAEITVYDNLGRVVFRETHRFHSGDDYETFDLRSWPAGLYHMVCKTNEGTHAFKFVKK